MTSHCLKCFQATEIARRFELLCIGI